MFTLLQPLPLAGRRRPGCAHKRGGPVVYSAQGGRWASPSLFSTEELLQQAEDLVQSGRVSEAEAVLSAVTGQLRTKPGVEWTAMQPVVATPAASRSSAARRKAGGVPQVLPQGPEWEAYSFNTPAAVTARAQEQAKLAELRLAAEVAHNVAVALGAVAGATAPTEERRLWLAVTPGMRATVAAVSARARARVSGSQQFTDASGMITHLSSLPLEEALAMLPSLQAALRDRLDGMALPSPPAPGGKEMSLDGDAVALMAGVAWLLALNGDTSLAYQLLTDATLLLPRRDGTQADVLLLTCYCAKLAQAKGALGEAQAHWTSVLAQADAIFGATTPNDVALDAMRALASLAAATGDSADMRRWWANVSDMSSGLEQQRSSEAPHLRAARMHAALGPVTRQRALPTRRSRAADTPLDTARASLLL